MIAPKPVVLERNGIRLEPIGPEHHDGLVSSAADGELWNLRFTSVPDAPGTPAYIANALKGQREGHMWLGRDDYGRGHHGEGIGGLTGKMDIIIEGKEHKYVFEYSMPKVVSVA